MDEFFGSYIISYVIFDDSCFGCRISHQDFKIFEPKGVGRIVFCHILTLLPLYSLLNNIKQN